MAVTEALVEDLASWCEAAPELNSARAEGRLTYFGSEVRSPADYWPGTGDVRSRGRRFLGWFMLDYELPDGRRPAELAAERQTRGDDLRGLLDAIRGARFVTARIASVIGGRGALLEIEDERLEVRSRAWSRIVRREGVMMAHLLPVRAGVWVPAPGWLVWPVEFGPNIRREMKRVFQPTPIEVEQILQGKARAPGEPSAPPSEDLTLADAVGRMTEAAQRAKRDGLVLPVEAWEALVLKYLSNGEATAFFRDVLDRLEPTDPDDLKEWLERAQAIWNATPQPDRGGMTAHQLSRQGRSV
jgi:hypothetical protein